MGRPSKDSNKQELNQQTRELALALRLHSPHMSAAEIERQLDIGTGESPGQTLSRWARAGQKGGRAADLDRLQAVTEKARRRGLLPTPQRMSGLRRYDPTRADSGQRASEVLAKQLTQARELERARAAAVSALTAYASAIEGAEEWLVVDSSEDSEVTGRPNERSGSDVLSMARQLEAHGWAFHPNF